MAACERVGMAFTCHQVWPNNLARWCDPCFERFGGVAKRNTTDRNAECRCGHEWWEHSQSRLDMIECDYVACDCEQFVGVAERNTTPQGERGRNE